jgi:glycosyltransferase involved in cell wall biosynthesis
MLQSKEFQTEVLLHRRLLWHPASWRRLLGTFTEALLTQAWIRRWHERAGRANEGTIVYTYWLGGATWGAALARKTLGGLRVISRAHGYDLYCERHVPKYLPLRHVILAGVNEVHAVSEHGAAYLCECWPEHRNRIRVSRLGVADPGFVTSPSRDGALRVVSCSFLIPLKRIDLLVDALAELARRNPGRRILWSHIGDGPLAQQLLAQAEDRLSNRIEYRFVGVLANPDVIRFYRENPVDVFVNVSTNEGIPVSVMEAQSCGIPVVATAVGGTPEIVNEDNGILLPPDPAPAEVAGALEMFMGGDAAAERRRNSRIIWQSFYSAERNYPRFHEALAGCGTIRVD